MPLHVVQKSSIYRQLLILPNLNVLSQLQWRPAGISYNTRPIQLTSLPVNQCHHLHRILTLLDLIRDLGGGGEVEELVGGAVGTVDALHLVQHVALRQHLVEVVPHVGAVRADAVGRADAGRRVPGSEHHGTEAPAAVAALARHHLQLLHHRRRVAERGPSPRHRQAARPLRLRPLQHGDSHHHQRHRHRHGHSAHLHRDRIWQLLHPGNKELCPNLNCPMLQ